MKLVQTVKIAEKPLVSLLPKADLEKLVAALEEVTYAKGEAVIQERDHGDSFYIIKAGEATVSTKQLSLIHI